MNMYEPEAGDKKGGVIRQSKRVIWSCEYIYIYNILYFIHAPLDVWKTYTLQCVYVNKKLYTHF